MDDIKGAIILVILSMLATSGVNNNIIRSENEKLKQKVSELKHLNGKYIDQMSPLQKVQNDIYCSDIEKDEYLKSVWDYKNKFGGKK